MSVVLNVLLPIFALILAGYLCRRSNRLGPTAASEINRLVVWLGLPALLFKQTAQASLAEVWQPGFLLAFGGGMLAVFVLTLVWRRLAGESLGDATLAALSAAYANTGYIGIPLCALVLGDAGMAPALIASLLVVCGLFGLALVCMELARHGGEGLGRALGRVLWSLLRNPLVLAPLLGGAWAFGGLPLPAALGRFLDLLGAATVPCALISLGLFLAQPQPEQGKGAWPLVALKMLGQPLLTWWLARALALPPLWAHSALLLSALPTGTGPFMLAEYYGCAAARASRTILLSTLGSLLSLSLLLILLHG